MVVSAGHSSFNPKQIVIGSVGLDKDKKKGYEFRVHTDFLQTNQEP